MQSTSSSLWLFSGASPMNLITAVGKTHSAQAQHAQAAHPKGPPKFILLWEPAAETARGFHSLQRAPIWGRDNSENQRREVTNTGYTVFASHTPTNMSTAILLRLLSLSSMRDSWMGTCEETKGLYHNGVGTNRRGSAPCFQAELQPPGEPTSQNRDSHRLCCKEPWLQMLTARGFQWGQSVCSRG